MLGDMSWTDEEIDELFQGAASEQSFPYKEEYWAEMEALLPEKNTGRDLLWTITALIFVTLLTVGFWRNEIPVVNNESLRAESTLNKEDLADVQIDNTSSVTSNQSEFKQNEILQSEPSTNVSEVNNSSLDSKRIQESLATSIQLEKDTYTEQKIEKAYLPESTTNLTAKSRSRSIENDEVSNLQARDIELLTTSNNDLLPLLNQVRMSGANHAYYVQGVIGASQSLVQPSGSVSSSFGFGAGWAMRKGNFVANAGLNLLVSNHSDLFLSRSAKVYGFGVENYSYNFNYKQLYELESQLDLGYQVKRSEFRLGLRPSYLLSSRVMISEAKSEPGKEMETLESEKQVYSFTGGLNRFGLKPSFTYAYHIKPTLELGLSLGAQMYSRIDADYLKEHTRNFVFDGQLYLRQVITWEKK